MSLCDLARCFALTFIGLAFSVLVVANSAHAASGAYDSGQVIAIQSCQQVFVVADGPLFSIVQTVGGPQVIDRDILTGDLRRIGITTLLNTSRSDEPVKVIILDVLLSSTQYHEHLKRYCR